MQEKAANLQGLLLLAEEGQLTTADVLAQGLQAAASAVQKPQVHKNVLKACSLSTGTC